jgi:histidinol-phosphate aminotransferase
MSSREGLVLAMEDLGFMVLPSQANFVFARHPLHDAATLAAGLRARGVLVRHFKLPRIDQYLRISVGTPQQCDALVQALAELL